MKTFIQTFGKTTAITVFLMHTLCVLSCTPVATDTGDESDDKSDKSDESNDDSSESDEVTCEDIEWTPEDHYLTKGKVVAKWKQSVFADENGNGKIDDDEMDDQKIDFVDLCETEKRSLVLLMATDN